MTRPHSLLPLVAALLISAPGGGFAQGHGAPPPPAAPTLPTLKDSALGRIRIFDDWAVACDNRLSCSAVSLVPEGAGEAYKVLVSIEREGGPGGPAMLTLTGADELKGQIELFVDNKQLALLTAARGAATMTGGQALGAIRALGSSYAFEIKQKTAILDAPSLSGLPEALRYMDEQQGRVGGAGALAAIGDGPADLAKPVPPPATFAIAVDGTPPAGPLELTDGERKTARALAVCDGRVREDHPIEMHGLDRGHALVLLPCDGEAYNVSSVPLIATGAPGARTFTVAKFDLMPGFTGEPGTPPLLVNANWNPARFELASFARGRALGDCGTSEAYRWDGTMFRLVEARSMPVCRGSWEWLILWSASPDAPPPRPDIEPRAGAMMSTAGLE